MAIRVEDVKQDSKLWEETKAEVMKNIRECEKFLIEQRIPRGSIPAAIFLRLFNTETNNRLQVLQDYLNFVQPLTGILQKKE